MTITFLEKDQIWQDEQTRYWFSVDDTNYCIADTCGIIQLLDEDGCTIEDCNDHGNIKELLMPEYAARVFG